MTADTPFTDFLAELNAAYARLHTEKEDAFWVARMGLRDDADAAREALDQKEIALQRFLQDPDRLGRTRERLARAEAAAADGGEGAPTEEELVALRGWAATFAAHAIESAEARALNEQIIEAEGRLGGARGGMTLGYEDPKKGFTKASSVELAVMLGTDRDGARRRAAWEGLRSIETFVLENGFLDIVRQRNRLGRMLGGEDYYDWKVRRVERMPKAAIFALLDELEEKTRDRAKASIEELRARVGAEQVTPWNARFLMSGDVTREQDPFFPFGRAVERWGRSFAALGIDYARARMVLDLVDREGKYENGFMHGPEIAWRDRGERRAARIHFTANAIPGMCGSGKRAAQTLFHEGGHAAHFANVDMPAPCFGQEFAPTSVAFAETQSMFLDSLLEDADWQTRYATGPDGAPMPWALVEKGIRAAQPFAAWNVRAWLAICYGERAIYEMPESELTPANVLAALRDVERRMLFLDDGSARPVLSVPHLLAGESSAYYHGYVLAEMAVHQTRAFFLERDGHLMDNPRIGPDLREAYWKVGNGPSFAELVRGLTGAPPSADALARHVNRTADEAIAQAKAAVERAKKVPAFSGEVDLGASIRVAHGAETVARLEPGGDFGAFADAFAAWVDERAAARAGASG